MDPPFTKLIKDKRSNNIAEGTGNRRHIVPKLLLGDAIILGWNDIQFCPTARSLGTGRITSNINTMLIHSKMILKSLDHILVLHCLFLIELNHD
jgi:hypothetical protein